MIAVYHYPVNTWFICTSVSMETTVLWAKHLLSAWWCSCALLTFTVHLQLRASPIVLRRSCITAEGRTSRDECFIALLSQLWPSHGSASSDVIKTIASEPNTDPLSWPINTCFLWHKDKLLFVVVYYNYISLAHKRILLSLLWTRTTASAFWGVRSSPWPLVESSDINLTLIVLLVKTLADPVFGILFDIFHLFPLHNFLFFMFFFFWPGESPLRVSFVPSAINYFKHSHLRP